MIFFVQFSILLYVLWFLPHVFLVRKGFVHLRWPIALSGCVNTLRPSRNEQHFADDIFKRIFFNKNVWISIKISLKFVPKGLINNNPALVQIMAWRRSGDKPLSETMLVRLPTHICVTRPHCVKATETHFTACLWTHNWKLIIRFALIMILMIQLRHMLAHVSTVQLWWH